MRKVTRLIALLSFLFATQIVHAQNTFTIHITEPADGAVITGPFTLRGDSTIPAEKQVTLRMTETTSSKVLVLQPLPLNGDVGTQGSFNLPINFNIGSDTPLLIEVFYAGAAGTVSAQVHVTLHKADAQGAAQPTAPDQSGMDASLVAAKLALLDYEARVKVVTPLPVSVQDQSFTDTCMGLARTNEQCDTQTVDGKIVKISYGMDAYIYHVGGTQARLDIDASTPIKQKNDSIPKLMQDAMTSTGVKLYIPAVLSGPFTGLPLAHIDWDSGIVTLKYSLDGNPADIVVTEQIFVPNAPIPAAGAGENLTLGTVTVPIQSVNGRRVIVWAIQGTLVTLSVPGSIPTASLSDLAKAFALAGSTQPGQINPFDLTQFDQLTLALPEPMRSVEMARQALLSVLRPPRRGKVVSLTTTTFKDVCMGLIRQQEAICDQNPTPGFVIGIADTELYRYHIAGNTLRLNRENSALVDNVGVEYATIDAAQGFVQFQIIAPNSPDLLLTGVQVDPGFVLLTYRDNKTGGAFSLTERDGNIASNPPAANNGNGLSQTFFVKLGGGQTQVWLWASPEVGTDGITRIESALSS